MNRDSVHPVSALGFERGAEAYERARPGYPPAVAELLAVEVGLHPEARVVDLAAGTGKFTRLLVEVGYEVVAVEPNPAMRGELMRALRGVEVLDGVAEALPLADGSVDAICAAQAFHWFDASSALAEAHRVLHPGGALVLVWNERDRSEPWVQRFEELVESMTDGGSYWNYTEAGPDGSDAHWAEVLTDAGGFTPLRSARFANDAPSSPELLVARAASTSFVAALGEEERAGVLAAVARFAAEDPDLAGRESFPFPHETAVYWCHRADDAPITRRPG